MEQALARGALYVVATPIGNRDDLSARAQSILANVDCVAAEDTRVSAALLAGCGIRARLISLHEHNELARVPQLVARLGRGETLALISDAGTPLVSDPGFALVRAARQAGHAVLSVPGPCAAIAALSVSGLPTDRFLFAGFLAAKSGARRRQFDAQRAVPATLVFYVSKRHVGKALEEACSVLGGERHAALCRELTKLHETTTSGTLDELLAQWPAGEQRGEFVLLIGGNTQAPGAGDLEAALDVLLEKLSTRDAAAVAARLLGVPRREAYAAALERGPRRDPD